MGESATEVAAIDEYVYLRADFGWVESGFPGGL
jgi:hypothetical protein